MTEEMKKRIESCLLQASSIREDLAVEVYDRDCPSLERLMFLIGGMAQVLSQSVAILHELCPEGVPLCEAENEVLPEPRAIVDARSLREPTTATGTYEDRS